jgi:two-component system sensor histidine kinase/response regulator
MENLYSKTILLVDDSPDNIDILNGLLTNFKRKVALNGPKAIKIASSENPPDLILLDIMMPEMDGFEVCEELNKNEATREIPVIFLSAKMDKADIVRGFELGAKDYVTKPFDPNELMARVKTHLELKDAREKLKEVNIWLEQKVAERTKELEAANKQLKELDNAKIEFLKLASHEIRTPLNGIFGSFWLMTESKLPEEIKGFINMMDISLKRLERFADRALMVTDLRTKNYRLKPGQNKVSGLISDAREFAHKQFGDKNIQFKVKPNPGWEVLVADPVTAAICFNEIIANAVKYSDPGGSVELHCSLENGTYTFKCVDEGKGFSEESLRTAYDVLTPGESHMDNNIGLSLSIIQLIMERHEGTIEVGNNPEKGAWVKLSFPQ